MADDNDKTGGVDDDPPPLKKPNKCYKLSLWLMPPLEVRNLIYEDIVKFAGVSGGIFEPHVTLIGGISCESHEEAKNISRHLQTHLEKSGHLQKPLWCAFSSEVKKSSAWHQACCVELSNYETSGFEDIRLACLEGLNLDPNSGIWQKYPEPFPHPHMSLHYSQYNTRTPDSNIDVYRVPSFKADRLELWCTDIDEIDSTVKKDVHKWYPIAVIPWLC